MTCEWVQPVKLTAEQRREILSELKKYTRSQKLRDVQTQKLILQRIEGALTLLGGVDPRPETTEPYDRVSDFSRSIRKTLDQISRLKEYERDNFELLGCDIEKLEGDLERAAAAAVKVFSGLRLGQGEKYGKPEENKSRLFASQLGELWRNRLELPTGPSSVFRKFLHVVCLQVELPVLGRDALDAVLNGAGKDR